MGDQSTGVFRHPWGRTSGMHRDARRRRVAVVALVAVVAAVLVIVGAGASTPGACTLCHGAQAEALSSSSHKGVSCLRCHAFGPRQVQARLDVALRMVPASLGGVELEGPGRPLGNAACIQCHGDILTGEVIEANGLRINHRECSASTQCAGCHSAAVHGRSTRVIRTSSMSECTVCHVERTVSVACDSCHKGKMPSDRVRDPVWVRTHGTQWEALHGLGDLRTCAVCHAPDDCAECHGAGVPHPADFGSTHGRYAIDTGRERCLTCHKVATFCESCHGGMEMPHPEGFLQRHSSIATSQEDPVCMPCHSVPDCVSCHTFHVHPGGARSSVSRGGRG